MTPVLATLLVAGLALAPATRAATVALTLSDAAGKPLSDAVVFLESPEARAAVKPVVGTEIAQVDRSFQPQVTVVTVGSAVHFPNRDTVRHHVYSFSPVKTFEIKLYIGTPAQPVVFDKPGIAVLGCNIHDSMAAWTVVVETPWYSRSAAGQAVLANVPPGSYRLRAWHPALPPGAPPLDQALTVVGARTTVALQLPVAP